MLTTPYPLSLLSRAAMDTAHPYIEKGDNP